MTVKVFIGGAAGFAGDRTDAAGPIVDTLTTCDGARFIMFETWPSARLALAQLERRARSVAAATIRRSIGSSRRSRALPPATRSGSSAISAPPIRAARPSAFVAIAREQGLPRPRVAVVEGDDIARLLSVAELAAREIDGIAPARRDQDHLGQYLSRRSADRRGARSGRRHRRDGPRRGLRRWRSGPLMHAFGWRDDDWDRLAAGTLAGHLLECGSADHRRLFRRSRLQGRARPRRARLSDRRGRRQTATSSSTKPRGTGGRRRPPHGHRTDALRNPRSGGLSGAGCRARSSRRSSVEEIGKDRVRVSGARGKPAPDTLKATVCVDGGVLGRGRDFLCRTECGARARGSPPK